MPKKKSEPDHDLDRKHATDHSDGSSASSQTEARDFSQEKSEKVSRKVSPETPDHAISENVYSVDSLLMEEEQKEAEETEPEISVNTLLQENEDLKERTLRLLAEIENLRRRTAKEIKDGRTYAITSFARDILSVGDNLHRALDSLSPEARSDARLTSFIEGIEMTERDMLMQLEKHGIERLSPQGARFDPHFHQAMFEVPTSDQATGIVVTVVQAGYKIGERVLRPALVGISKSLDQETEGKPSEDEEEGE